jgi:hypothetical protein
MNEWISKGPSKLDEWMNKYKKHVYKMNELDARAHKLNERMKSKSPKQARWMTQNEWMNKWMIKIQMCPAC